MIIPAQTSLQDSGRVSVDGKIIELFSCHTGYMSVPVHLDFFYFLSAVSEGSTAILSESEFTVTPPTCNFGAFQLQSDTQFVIILYTYRIRRYFPTDSFLYIHPLDTGSA